MTAASLLALVPGGTLTLMVGTGDFRPEYCRVTWPLAAGTRVYAQVDSDNTATTYGTVLETHELTGAPYDNLFGPVVFGP